MIRNWTENQVTASVVLLCKGIGGGGVGQATQVGGCCWPPHLQKAIPELGKVQSRTTGKTRGLEDTHTPPPRLGSGKGDNADAAGFFVLKKGS